MSTKSPTEISKEELEKAANVRLFEKVAAVNGIDLNKLDNTKLAEMYRHFEAEVLPRIIEQDQQEKQAAAVHAKLASLTEPQIWDLFEKQAAAEPDLVAAGGLGELSDDQLKLGFAHFLENVLPIMAAQDFAPVTPEQASKIAEVQEAQVKLAEAEALGRHMARAFYDEASKLAAAGTPTAPAKTASGTEVATSSIGKRLAGLARANAKPLAAGATVGFAAGRASKGEKQANAVTLSPDAVGVLAKLAESDDLDGFKSVTAEIMKAAELPPQFQKKDEKKDEKDEKGEKGEGAEKKASALDLLIEERATALHRAYLVENGLLKE